MKQNVDTDTACTMAPSGLFDESLLIAGERSPEMLDWLEDATCARVLFMLFPLGGCVTKRPTAYICEAGRRWHKSMVELT